jgi:hypothetical protein
VAGERAQRAQETLQESLRLQLTRTNELANVRSFSTRLHRYARCPRVRAADRTTHAC